MIIDFLLAAEPPTEVQGCQCQTCTHSRTMCDGKPYQVECLNILSSQWFPFLQQPVEHITRADVCVRAHTLKHFHKVRFSKVFWILGGYITVRGRERGFDEVLVSGLQHKTNGD